MRFQLLFIFTYLPPKKNRVNRLMLTFIQLSLFSQDLSYKNFPLLHVHHLQWVQSCPVHYTLFSVNISIPVNKSPASWITPFSSFTPYNSLSKNMFQPFNWLNISNSFKRCRVIPALRFPIHKLSSQMVNHIITRTKKRVKWFILPF